MDSNTHSTSRRERLAALTAEIDAVLAQDLDQLTEVALAEDALELRPQIDRLQGGWGRPGPAVRVHGGLVAGEVADGRHHRHQPGPDCPGVVPRPLPASGAALCAGELSAAHAEVLATSTLPPAGQAIQAAEPILLDTARRLDPTGLPKVVSYFADTVDPDRANARAPRCSERRGCG
jgi:hypothetical protein